MITSDIEYQHARGELRYMEEFLADVERRQPPAPLIGYTKAGIRKMIARLHEELAVYEGGTEHRPIDASAT